MNTKIYDDDMTMMSNKEFTRGLYTKFRKVSHRDHSWREGKKNKGEEKVRMIRNIPLCSQQETND